MVDLSVTRRLCCAPVELPDVSIEESPPKTAGDRDEPKVLDKGHEAIEKRDVVGDSNDSSFLNDRVFSCLE